MIWDLSALQLLVTGAFICCTSFISGWLTDKILGRTGFGVVGNWLLLLLGAYVGIYAYNLNGYYFEADSTRTIFVVGGAGVLMLLSFMALKRVTNS